jgi:dTMP kinase
MGKRGRFFVFEGPDGSGKSTQARLLASYLENRGISVVLTRDPGGTPAGEKIRDLVLDAHNSTMSCRTELLLYMASRSQLVDEIIKPSLESSHTVICDRYVYSSAAYQGWAGGIDTETIARIGDFATGSLVPDRVFLIDCDAEQGLNRIQSCRDRMERKDAEFHKKVREAYLQIADENPDIFSVIDGSLPIEAVFEKIREQADNEI